MDRIRYLQSVVFLSLLLFANSPNAGSGIWTDELKAAASDSVSQQKASSTLFSYRYLRADAEKLKSTLHAAPMESTASLAAYIDLPMPDGESHLFTVEESPVMAPELAAKYPTFRTYRVRSAGDEVMSGRLDLVPAGFHAYLTTDKGVVVIDPDPDSKGYYRSFYKRDVPSDGGSQFSCGVDASTQAQTSTVTGLQRALPRTTNELLTYRLAVAATYEYSQKVAGGDIANTQAEIVTAINRINEIYERDLAIFLQLIPNNDQLISTVQGELPNNSAINLINQIKAYIEGIISASDYDIGHVFSTGGGGLATFQSVCGSFKAQGMTGLANPTGDEFYIEYVAHEIGHQFGADHTFNGTTNNCSSRNAATAYEPGSGTTIMAYAGICGIENLQSSSIDTFHAGSIAQIINFTRSGTGNNCAAISTTGNTAPVANAGNDYTIPISTPFALTGSATDGNGDTLTYQWDEMDLGASTDSTTLGTDLGTNPLFQSFTPSSSPTRILPRMQDIISGTTKKGEVLPQFGRTMNFRLTVRDQNGGVDEDNMKVTVDQSSGPFSVVTASASPVTLDVTQPQVIEWEVACTDVTPVSCSYVDILLSTDGGTTFPTTLLASAPNIGEAEVTFPNITSTDAVLKIACSDNIFFDLTDEKIRMQQGSGVVLLSTGTGSATVCGSPSVPPSPVGGTTFDVSNAVTVDLNGTISDSVDDVSNDTDVFRFIGSSELYTFELSLFGSSNLNLYLADSEGNVLLQNTGVDTKKTISTTLSEGATYHLVVLAVDTGGTTQSYVITTARSAIPGVFTGSDGSSGSMNLWFLLVIFLCRCIYRQANLNHLR